MTLTIHTAVEQGSMPLNLLDVIRRVRQVLEYYPETGDFVWIDPPKRHPRLLGKRAGGDGSGYTMIKIDGQKFKAHRIAWLVMTGEWPPSLIDHADGNGLNNAWKNLRLCDQTQNNGNRARNKGKTLPKGVRKIGRRFQARIRYKGNLKTLGTYDSPEQAGEAYAEAAHFHFENYARQA